MSARRTTLVVVGLVIAFLAPMSTAYALWSRSASATVNVSVQAAAAAPSAPVLSCVSATGTSLSWTATGSTYDVYESGSATSWPPGALVQGTSATTYTVGTSGWAQSEVRYYRVIARNSGGASSPSNVIKISRNGNSANYICGAP